MKKLLKVILPPFVAFLIFAALIKYDPLAKHIGGLAQIGTETLYGLMSYFKIFTPLLFVTALLTQLLIVIPLWRNVLSNHKRLFATITGVCVFTIVLSAAISYIIWDNATGTSRLIAIFLFIACVQVFYWLINFGVLYLLDRKAFVTKPDLTTEN